MQEITITNTAGKKGELMDSFVLALRAGPKFREELPGPLWMVSYRVAFINRLFSGSGWKIVSRRTHYPGKTGLRMRSFLYELRWAQA